MASDINCFGKHLQIHLGRGGSTNPAAQLTHLSPTLDHDTPLQFRNSVGEIFGGPATIQKVYQGINGFPSWRGYNDWQFWVCWNA